MCTLAHRVVGGGKREKNDKINGVNIYISDSV